METNLFFLSFLSTNYYALKKHWDKYSIMTGVGKRGSDRPFKGNLGGKICLLNWNTKKIIWQINIDSPSGILYRKGTIYANSINQGKVFIISFSKRKVIGEINHPHLNKPHSLLKTKRGFLISSTGLDTILEIDHLGKTIYEFFLTEHGYPRDQFGNVRKINKKLNHQQIVYPSLNHTTHVNYARYIDHHETKIISTLFHTGEIIEIGKKTNDVRIVLKKTKQPHGVNNFSRRHYIVCDTGNNVVLILDKKNYNVFKKIDGPYSWVQDAVKKGRYLYIADADNHRVVRINPNNGVTSDVYNFPKSDRIYQILPISKL